MKRLSFIRSKLIGEFSRLFCLALLGAVLFSARAGYAQEPVNIDPLLAKGEMAFNLNNYDEAREWYGKVLEIEPNNVPALIGSGMCELEAGNIIGAETSFRRALQLAPANTSVLLGMARTLIFREDYNGALEMLKQLNAKGKELAPQVRVAVIYYSAVVFRELGKLDLAKKNFSTVARQRIDRRLADASSRELKQLGGQSETTGLADAVPTQRAARKQAGEEASMLSGKIGAGFQYDSNVLLEPEDYEIADQEDTREVGLFSIKFMPLSTAQQNLSLDYLYYQNYHNGSRDTKALNISLHMIGANYAASLKLGDNQLLYGSGLTYNRILLALGRGPDYGDYSQAVGFAPFVGYAFGGQQRIELRYAFRNTDFFERSIPYPVAKPYTTEDEAIRGDDGIAMRDSIRHQVNLLYKIDLGKTSWDQPWISLKPEIWYVINRVKSGADKFYDYDLMAGSLGFTGSILEDLSWRFSGTYEFEDHTSDPRPEVNPDLKKRRDNRIIWNVALVYQAFDWLAAEATYRYRTQHSKYDMYTFDRSIAGLMLYFSW